MKHIEEYGFITIKQAHKIFFNDRQTGYDLARKRLFKLAEQGHMKGYIDYLSPNPEKIYYLNDKYKSPTKHTILIMDAYAEIVNLGGRMLYFKREEKWELSNRRSDGYCIFAMEGLPYEIFIEVKYRMGTDQVNKVDDINKKYTEILNSGECESKFKRIFNTDKDLETYKVILVVDPYSHKTEWEVDDEKVVKVDYTFKGIGRILI